MADMSYRNEGLGGTDMAVVLGLSPWKSRLELYLEKKGLSPPINDNEAMAIGRQIEGFIADLYLNRMREEMGEGVYLIKPPVLRHPEEGWALGSPDRILVDKNSNWLRGVEIKNVGPRAMIHWGSEDELRMPDAYYIQSAHYLWLARSLGKGVDRWDLAALLGGSQFRVYPIEHEPDIEGALLDAGRAFWHEHVEAGRPPMAEHTARDERALNMLYSGRGEELVANNKLEACASRLDALNRRIQDLQLERTSLVVDLKQAMGDAPRLVGDGWRVTWRRSKERNQTDWKAVASSAGATEEQVTQHTKTAPGSRPFLFRTSPEDTP